MSVFQYGIACSLEAEVPQSWPIVLRGEADYLAHTAKRLGYQTIELQLCTPARYDGHQIREVMDSYGLRVAALATGREQIENGLNLTAPTAGVRRATIARLKEHIRLAQILGAIVIVGTLRGNIDHIDNYSHYESLLLDGIGELADYAAHRQVTLVVENILSSLSNYLNTIQQVTDFVRLTQRPNVKVHLDTYSMLAEENDIAGAIDYCKAHLGYVHYSDSGRYYPGRGNVDFKTFTKELLKAGYRGDIVVECCPDPSQQVSAQQAIRYMQAVEDCARVELAHTHNHD